jgi:hypothetical protein
MLSTGRSDIGQCITLLHRLSQCCDMLTGSLSIRPIKALPVPSDCIRMSGCLSKDPCTDEDLLLLRSRERASRDRPQERIIRSELRPWPDRRNKLSRLMPLLDFVGRKTQQGHRTRSNRRTKKWKTSRIPEPEPTQVNAFDVGAFTII